MCLCVGGDLCLLGAEGGEKNNVGTCDSQHVFKNIYTTKRMKLTQCACS